MTSQPDKLFRDHLENFQKPAPSSAWERIESGLERRHSKMLWIKIAASVIVLAAASILLWPKQDVSSPSIVQKPDLPTIENPVTPTPPLEAPIASTPIEEPNQMVISKSNSDKTLNQHTKETSNVKKDVATVDLDLQSETLLEIDPNASEFEIEPAIQGTEPPSEATPIVLAAQPTSTMIYSMDEVNSRFIKKNVPYKATSEAKSTSGIKKLMALATDLKHDDSLYGDLREKKNEILNFGFLDDRQGSDR